MPTPSTTHRTGRGTLCAAVLVVVLASCSAPAPDQTESSAGAPSGQGLPSDHVHGVAFNPADDKVYLATHDGLFRYDDTGPAQVGPVIDLMGSPPLAPTTSTPQATLAPAWTWPIPSD